MNNLENTVRDELFKLQDLGYRDFHAKLMPTVDKDKIIGIRTPLLRKFARDFNKTPEAKQYLDVLPHKYYEENNLHGFLIEQIKDYDETVARLDKFLPFVDNWATCDLIKPKAFKKRPSPLLTKAEEWMRASDTYTVRFGIGVLINYYLDDGFDSALPQTVADIRSEEYYINMMIAWYFATALAKQYEAALPYLEEKRLDVWTHNKTIQKAVESYRITDEQKAYLKTLKIK